MAGDNPDLAENDAALDPEHWTGCTGIHVPLLCLAACVYTSLHSCLLHLSVNIYVYTRLLHLCISVCEWKLVDRYILTWAFL